MVNIIDIANDYLLNKITFDDVYEKFNELIYQIIKKEAELYEIN